ncbi:CHRD domain-containing protein [Belliella pelovolcani]|uniref:CHRD domain-containing protein n=1 Tax=Belliella pelovolcani TaxID=529505 RepID=UPI0039191DCF
MKNSLIINRIKQGALLLMSALIFVACTEDDMPALDPDEVLTGQSKSYDLDEVAVPGISGTAVLEETSTGSTKLTITLSGTPDGVQHPAHIHFNSAATGGGIAVSLTPVNGTTGISETIISRQDDGSSLTYNQLLDFDGYINVHLSADDLGTIVAQGDIGSNELTGETKTYTLNEADVDGISGEIIFEERRNGFALATINLTGTPDGGVHPAHIHANSAAIGGGILFTFNPVNGTTGMSMTDTRAGMMDGEEGYTYDEILEVDGYVNVHLSAEALATIVAQGDIGSNELTGVSQTYPLAAVVAGISGEITFQERINGFALATITLVGTPVDGSHPAHIHENSAAVGGGILYTFNPVNGATGVSISDTRQGMMDGEASYTYAQILTVDGYVNVHLSAAELATIVAQGDIGVNFE